MRLLMLHIILTLWAPFTFAQTITSAIPAQIDTSATYLFYLHGGIVQEQGINAVSKDFGPYEYLRILDTLRQQGFNIISEARPKGTNETRYAENVARQIDSLLQKGLPPGNVLVVGASQGGFITVEIAHLLKNSAINYVVLGVCNEYNINYYQKIRPSLCGNFLSIYESSDNKGSCNRLLGKADCKNTYSEVALHMGNGHGFIYKPYPQWVGEIVRWVRRVAK